MLQQLTSENYYQYAGYVSQNYGTLPRFRTYTTLTWTYRGASVTLANTFIPSVNDIGTGGDAEIPAISVPSFTQWDINGSYQLSALRLSLGYAPRHSLAPSGAVRPNSPTKGTFSRFLRVRQQGGGGKGIAGWGGGISAGNRPLGSEHLAPHSLAPAALELA